MSAPFVFVHIQKTGGSSIRAALGMRENEPDKHRTAAELRDRYGERDWEQAFTFAFVRNPWDRLVSWWSMIDSLRPRLANPDWLNAFMRYVLTNATTFEEFLLNCDAEIADTDGTKCIYRNQLDYIADGDGRILVDFVGRFERLEADFAQVRERIGGPPGRAFGRRNASRHEHYSRYYSSRTADLVGQRYARDLAAFGYRFETG